jgi:hypothetical protein
MKGHKDLPEKTEKKIFITIGVLGFLGALICLSPNMTGNAIGELNQDSSSLLGLVFFIIGIAAIGVARIKA